jgi:hypothetical protein
MSIRELREWAYQTQLTDWRGRKGVAYVYECALAHEFAQLATDEKECQVNDALRSSSFVSRISRRPTKVTTADAVR